MRHVVTMSEADRRIPSLDGIRAVLVVVVFTAHLLGTKNFPLARDALPMEHWAYLAMRIFFIISGFLITGILLRELDRKGTIGLSRFYFKRTFRIFPAYYVFLLVMASVSFLGMIRLNPGDLLHAVTYTANYNPDRAWHLGHTWSLSVEEQFYMLWPLVLLLLGKQRAMWTLVALMAVIPLWRILLLALPGGTPGVGVFQAGMGHTFDTTADVIAVGCLLAILRPRLWEFGPYRRLLQSPWMAAVLLFAVIVPLIPEIADRMNEGVARYGLLTAHQAVGLPAVNICIGVLLDWAMRNPAGQLGRFLNTPLAIKVGMMSYSLYLWQQVFLNRHSQHFITAFPLNVILAIACGWASYRFVEMPCLAWRERLDRKRWGAAATPAESSAIPSQAEPVFATAENAPTA